MTQSETLHLWWLHLDELTRRRVLKLDADETLPDDVAADLIANGIPVTDLGHYVAEGGHVVRAWAQPTILMDLIFAERYGHPGPAR